MAERSRRRRYSERGIRPEMTNAIILRVARCLPAQGLQCCPMTQRMLSRRLMARCIKRTTEDNDHEHPAQRLAAVHEGLGGVFHRAGMRRNKPSELRPYALRALANETRHYHCGHNRWPSPWNTGGRASSHSFCPAAGFVGVLAGWRCNNSLSCASRRWPHHDGRRSILTPRGCDTCGWLRRSDRLLRG